MIEDKDNVIGKALASVLLDGAPIVECTAQCARLKRYPPDQRIDMLAMLVEARAKWERDHERAVRRRVEETAEQDDDDEG